MFGSYLNMDPTVFAGLRFEHPQSQPGRALYAEWQGGIAQQHPPEGCANEYCRAEGGRQSFHIVSAGLVRHLLPEGQSLELALSAGAGAFLQRRRRLDLPSYTNRFPALALGVSGSSIECACA